MLLFVNFRGGIDVTEHFSETPIDPLRPSSLIVGTSKSEESALQWSLLVLLSVALALVLWLVMKAN